MQRATNIHKIFRSLIKSHNTSNLLGFLSASVETGILIDPIDYLSLSVI